MLKTLRIKNYRSILDATIELRPFTILVGANGSGKSNLLKLLVDLSGPPQRLLGLPKHHGYPTAETRIEIDTSSGNFVAVSDRFPDQRAPEELASVRLFTIDPTHVGGEEQPVSDPVVHPRGNGAIQVLDSLKTGDREDLFQEVERQLREFAPEIEKLSFVPGGGVKRLQVRERGIPIPVPVSELSEGTRLVLTILTIVHQQRRPSLICFEDLDRRLHPALFGKVADVCRTLIRLPGAPQIIATTHNPYLVDQFVDETDNRYAKPLSALDDRRQSRGTACEGSSGQGLRDVRLRAKAAGTERSRCTWPSTHEPRGSRATRSGQRSGKRERREGRRLGTSQRCGRVSGRIPGYPRYR